MVVGDAVDTVPAITTDVGDGGGPTVVGGLHDLIHDVLLVGLVWSMGTGESMSWEELGSVLMNFVELLLLYGGVAESTSFCLLSYVPRYGNEGMEGKLQVGKAVSSERASKARKTTY